MSDIKWQKRRTILKLSFKKSWNQFLTLIQSTQYCIDKKITKLYQLRHNITLLQEKCSSSIAFKNAKFYVQNESRGWPTRRRGSRLDEVPRQGCWCRRRWRWASESVLFYPSSAGQLLNGLPKNPENSIIQSQPIKHYTLCSNIT